MVRDRCCVKSEGGERQRQKRAREDEVICNKESLLYRYVTIIQIRHIGHTSSTHPAIAYHQKYQPLNCRSSVASARVRVEQNAGEGARERERVREDARECEREGGHEHLCDVTCIGHT